ncbi:two-component system response regulator CreB [Vandammella animalimorsus]|uniref:Two-component system response regulator CreB n=1 Tax=Vandammella animalimorsus TaxID=2029117 RepID=A0A2A2B0S1_9BURK|nr:two-component system response regulator CreB [Vandammella animalimorsus]PAT43663.1 two-component system response regulator CreB [Vandammella animalimorsus]
MSERILIVEDEPAIAQTLAYALQAEGFATEWVALGAAALQALQLGAAPQPQQPQQPSPFALAVLDVGLPDMSGFDLCRTIRQHGELPVLFLTARSDEVDRIVGLEIGADDYVSKPFSPREVASRVRAILRRTRKGGAGAAAQPQQSQAGDAAQQGQQGQARGPFLHDESGLRIAFHGQWLSLTRYEYRLLATLLARPGRVFSRAVLMEKVWSDAQESLDRTVDAHIKTLRAKLRAVQAEADPIETHRGLGYSLRA